MILFIFLNILAAEEISPDSIWPLTAAARNMKTEPAEYEIPKIPLIHGYIPVIAFELELADKKSRAMPCLQINSIPLPLNDRKMLPRLLNRQNQADGGSGNYFLNLKDLIHPKQVRRLKIFMHENIPFEIKNSRIFYKAEVRSLIPDPPRVEEKAFRIHPGKTLRIDYKGEPFIINENVIGTAAIRSLSDKEQVVRNSAGEIIAHNLVHLGDKMVDFRREAYLTPRGELELAFRAVYKQPQQSNEGYQFTIPAKLLDGAEYEFRYGVNNAYNTIKGKFDFSVNGPANRIFYNAENKRIYTHLRWLFIRKGDMKLVFDFSPMGECGFGANNYCNLPAGSVSFIHRYGDKLVFGLTKLRRPERISNLVRIHSGDYDYYYRHGNTMVGYANGAYLDNLGYRISFAGRQENALRNANLPEFPWWRDSYQMPFQSAVRIPPDVAALLPGWTSLPATAAHFSGGAFFPLSAGLKIPSGNAEYTLPMEPGVYLCALIAGNWKEATGPFYVECNGEKLPVAVTVAPGRFRHLFFSVYLKEPEKAMHLKFSGNNISLNQLIIRNFIVDSEDYTYRRGFWNIPGLPDFGLRRDYTRSDSAGTKLPGTVINARLSPEITPSKAFASRQEPQIAKPAPPLSDTLEWAWNLRACFIGTGNSESGFGFMDETQLRAICSDLKARGFNTILEQGLFWYNIYPEETRKEHMIHQRRVNETIHECGMKVIRHADGTSFTSRENGVAAISEMMHALPIDAGALKSWQGSACISNPELRRAVFESLGRYVRETDCDGLMIDECTVSSAPRCVCAYCREKFTRDTGCVLPMPDEAKELFRQDNPLHSRWEEWKQRQSGEFYLALRQYMSKIKPDIIITNYGVDFQMPEGRTPSLVPALDIVGTEGTGHHLLLNYRSLYANRKLITSLGDAYGHPRWHSHISDNALQNSPLAGYLYWAFNSLTRTGLMMFSDSPAAEAGNILRWPYRMDFRNKESIADIAIFHRTDFRYNYFSQKPHRIWEGFGISQMLSDFHIPADFICKLERVEDLKKYRVIFLGNIAQLSDSELQILRQYAEQGGKLIITGVFANEDRLYRKAPGSRTHVFGFEIPDKNILQPVSLQYSWNGKQISLKSGLTSLRSMDNAEILSRFADGRVALLRTGIGKGVCIVTPAVPGMSNYEDLLFSGRPLLYRYDPGAGAMIRDLLNASGYTEPPLATDRIIPKLLIEACRDTKKRACFIQLLNMNTDCKAVIGKIPPTLRLSQKDFIRPGQPLRISMASNFSHAEAVSPDFDGIRMLQVRALRSGRTEVVIPEELINIYTLIRLK